MKSEEFETIDLEEKAEVVNDNNNNNRSKIPIYIICILLVILIIGITLISRIITI
jgi:hypothetical protein